ncbi:indolepyruvate ferredoxin oxidoreductase subunit beta [Desulfofundulus salinus]|uniref:Indolepyruvate ferredoxin oxidoreductase subunit beta n=1 Tax=Desulfofundulus salinus TaxID=2419843 RepID=A0A494WZW2_9FIRM|nr:indolepyruvate ferredoxin oxidoreductase subunit beta [Desulfofundulus salinum]RKO66094.1 indolepyruvate ferredoxin oxidoreductase subunit beta [Desulfofundulus salinum]
MKFDLVITGVGGQGTVLASRIVARAAMDAGWQVRTSETIGMAQREGCVVSHVRVGENLAGALVPDGRADVLLGFELAEAVRALAKLKAGGKAIVNEDVIVPTSVSVGLSRYQVQDIREYLEKELPGVCFLRASEVAREAGNSKTANVVMLGALSTLPGLPFSPEGLLEAVLKTVPSQFREINRKAFEMGRRAMGVC